MADYLGKDDPFLVIIGPSGSGKSEIVRHLQAEDIILLTPSWTTRQRRQDETTDIDHIFANGEEFEAKRRQGYFLETVSLFGNSNKYGLSKIAVSPGKIPAVLLRSMVLPLLGKHYTQPIIYQIESDEALLHKRLNIRENNRNEIERRMKDINREISDGRSRAIRVFQNNGELSYVIAQIKAGIKSDFTI